MAFAIIRCMTKQCKPGTLSPPHPLHLSKRLEIGWTLVTHYDKWRPHSMYLWKAFYRAIHRTDDPTNSTMPQNHFLQSALRKEHYQNNVLTSPTKQFTCNWVICLSVPLLPTVAVKSSHSHFHTKIMQINHWYSTEQQSLFNHFEIRARAAVMVFSTYKLSKFCSTFLGL